MKRLWIAVGIIALLTGLTLGNTGYLNQFIRSQSFRSADRTGPSEV